MIHILDKYLPVDAVNQGYRLINRAGTDHFWLQHKVDGEYNTACFFGHTPSIAEVKEEFERHRERRA